MPTAELAVDTRGGLALCDLFAIDAAEPMLVPDPPGPGDPDGGTDPDPVTVWAAPRAGVDVRLQLQATVTHEPLGELRTALVEEWDEDVEQATSMSATASMWDPLWQAAATATSTYRGRPVYEWDPKGYEVLVSVDGIPDWTGVFRQPLDHGGDLVSVSARSPEALFDEDTLGRVEQYDHLEDWGNFERYAIDSTPPGLRLVPNPGATMTAVVVAGGVRGSRCLRVTGSGWVESPHVALEGQDGVGRTAEGSAFGKFVAAIPQGTPVVQTLVQRADALAPSNLEATVYKQGLRPGDGGGWSDAPIASGATMTPDPIIHHTWVRIAGFDGVDTDYDLVRLQQGVQSGSLIDRPYSWYADRFLRDAQNEALGGSSWGLRTRIVSASTGSAQIQVSHNNQPRLSDVLRQTTDVDGGCAIYVDPSWTAQIMARRGQVRTDVAFTPENIVDCRWAVDPGAEFDDFIVDTGRGTGTSLVTSTVSAPRVAGRHRIATIVRVANDWPISRCDAYAAQQAKPALLRNVTCELDVRWEYAKQVACGDTLPVVLVGGNLGLWTLPLRVMNKRKRPRVPVVTFTMGNADG